MSKKEKPTFSKEQLLTADRYADKRDLLSALLTDGEDYTLDEVDQKINDYMEGGID